MIDLAIVALVLVYFGLGYWTGIIRRFVGMLSLYLAFFAATASGPTAANVVQQVYPNWAQPDQLMAGFFAVVVLMLLIVEVLASFYHSHLQLAAVLVDKGSGAVVGALTALVGISVALWLLLGASQPSAGSPDNAEIQIHDTITKAVIAPTILGSLSKATKVIFAPVIPNDPATYFNNQAPRLQH
jgi:uncharacterized membrane protein required for colicin V production